MPRMEDRAAHLDRLRKLKVDLSSLADAITSSKLKEKWLKHIAHIEELTTVISRID